MKKNMKKIVAVSLTGILTASLLVGNIEYATHTFSLNSEIAKAAVKETKETADTNESGSLDTDEVTKQETVYVNMSAEGKNKEVVVADWLKNAGINGEIQDQSDLTDIENVKGNEKFTQDGNKLTWDAGKNDIYYQGKTDKKLPVSMDIEYTLDGKKVNPKEILGKSGKLEIKISYHNTSKKTVSLNGENTDIYTPFMMITGMILPVDKFTNVTIDNGTIVSEGDNDLVVAYGLPGLKESLDLDNLDFGEDMDIDSSKINDKITDTVKITADVKDFEMNSSYTVATNQIFNDFDFDKIDDMDDLSDKVDDLTDASTKLINGSKDLQEGTQKLKDNFKDYDKAIHKIDKGVNTLRSGSKDLKKGVKDYTKGADKLLKGVNTYVDGTTTLANGVTAYTAGTAQLVDAVGQLRTATKDMPTQYAALGDGIDKYVASVNTLLAEKNMKDLSDGAANLKNGIGQVDDGLKQVQAGVAQIQTNASALNGKKSDMDQCTAGLTQMRETFNTEAETYKATYAQLKAAGLENSENGKKVAAAITQYSSMVAALDGALAYIGASEQFAAGIDAATNGTADGELDADGAKDLAAALAKLEAATNKESTEQNLYTGAASLETAVNTMSGYAKQLRDNSDALTKGNSDMKNGVSTLTSSIEQMDTAAGKLTANNAAMNKGAEDLIKNAPLIKKNSKKLTKNSSALREGAQDLYKGTGTLHDGMEKLVSATSDVSDGISDLNDGAIKIKNGMKKFDREGISKIADAVDDLLDCTSDLNDRLSQISKAASDYSTFSGNDATMDSSVKFIFATEELEKDED